MESDLGWLSDPAFSEAIADVERLLSLGRCAFLLGAGCSCCAGLPLMHQLTDQVLNATGLSQTTKEVVYALRDQFGQSSASTVEDYMSELVDLLSIAERRLNCGADCTNVSIADRAYTTVQIRQALAEIKLAIAGCIDRQDIDMSNHRAFVRAVHNGLRSGKSQQSATVHYFTLNYDTILEDSLGMEQIAYADGFCGGVTGWWEPSTLEDERVSARVVKIHGSIDWSLLEGDTRPRRLRKGLAPEGQAERVMIWPAATKYREAQRDPYAQMITLMRQVLRPQQPYELVLTVCGYRFGDSHINLELDRALRESEQRLTIIAFTSDEEPTGQLESWIGDAAIRNQVRVYAKRGIFHGGKSHRSSQDLSWWRFETLTRILEGER